MNRDEDRGSRWDGKLLLFAVIGVMLTVEFASDVAYKLRYYGWGDFRAFYSAAAALEAGGDIYNIDDLNAAWIRDGDLELSPDIFHIFTYPPLFAGVLRPLAALPFRTAVRVWMAINVILWLACLYGVVRYLDLPADHPAFWLIWLTGLRFEPALSTFTFGQVNIFLFALVLGALIAHKHRRSSLCGWLLAAAVMTKVTPIVLAGYFVIRREWRSLAWTIGALLILLSVSVAWLGSEIHVDYVTRVLPKLSQGFARPHNQSITAWFLRLFIASGWQAHLDIALVVARVVGLAVGLVALRELLREPRKGASAIGVCLCILTISLVSPVTWTHHLAWLILPLGMLYKGAFTVRPGSLPERAALLASVAVVAVLNDYYVHPVFQSGILVLISSAKLYGVAILFGLTVLMMARRRIALDEAL